MQTSCHRSFAAAVELASLCSGLSWWMAGLCAAARLCRSLAPPMARQSGSRRFIPRQFTCAEVKKSFFVPAVLLSAVLSPASPPPLHPRRGEGELEYPIWFFCLREVFLDRGAARRICWPRLVNDAVVVNGLGLGAAAFTAAVAVSVATARATRSAPRSVCKVSAANEHVRYSGFLGHRPC